MSVESVARDFIAQMTDQSKAMSMLAPGATVSGGVLPQPMPAMEAFNMMGGLMAGFPDVKFDVKDVSVNGNQATVMAQISGTNTGELNMLMPGMPSMPATGKKVSFADRYVVTVDGDKVTHMHVDSPADGGIPAMLAQLGAKMPGM